jgi:hypothetical protein
MLEVVISAEAGAVRQSAANDNGNRFTHFPRGRFCRRAGWVARSHTHDPMAAWESAWELAWNLTLQRYSA